MPRRAEVTAIPFDVYLSDIQDRRHPVKN